SSGYKNRRMSLANDLGDSTDNDPVQAQYHHRNDTKRSPSKEKQDAGVEVISKYINAHIKRIADSDLTCNLSLEHLEQFISYFWIMHCTDPPYDHRDKKEENRDSYGVAKRSR